MVTQQTVTQATQTRTATTPTKRPYRPHIRLVDASRGLYTVQSETYRYILYGVDTINGTCECAAGQQGFRNCKKHGGVCKHLHICRAYAAYRVAPTHLRPAVPSFAELAEAFAALPTPTFDFSALRATAPAFIPAPASLMECFS